MAIRGCECGIAYDVPNGGSVDHSHGHCPKCTRSSMIPTFRRQQVAEGNEPCYATRFGCEKEWCTFHPLCAKSNPSYADVEEVNRRVAIRNSCVAQKGRVHSREYSTLAL